MFVEGEPISDISAVTLWENNQKSPAPIPEKVLILFHTSEKNSPKS